MTSAALIEKAEEAARDIAEAVGRDPGGRGLLSGAIETPARRLAISLSEARRAVLLTGFPVRLPDGSFTGETDGPSGTANIARALEECGAVVTVLTDRTCLPQIAAALEARGCGSTALAIPEKGQKEFFENLFTDFRPTHLITLERPGKARDGSFRNMRGVVIDGMITDSDAVIPAARGNAAEIISVGDGGNELGMGALRPLIEERVPHGELICADEAADIALVSGVSNWWGWGIAAVLSVLHGKDLLPSPETERKMLRAVIASGGADGCTAKAEETVDDLPMEVHLAVLNEVRKIVNNAI